MNVEFTMDNYTDTNPYYESTNGKRIACCSHIFPDIKMCVGERIDFNGFEHLLKPGYLFKEVDSNDFVTVNFFKIDYPTIEYIYHCMKDGQYYLNIILKFE